MHDISTTENAVTLNNVSYAYQPGEWIVRGCNACFGKRRVAAVLGPNGRGKTTLLKLLIGAMKPSEGNITSQGEIAFVPQLFDTAFNYTAVEMVMMGRAKRLRLFSQPSRHDLDLALAMMDRFGIAHLANHPFDTLSGGQRQLVIFARALVAEADIIILDEPTSALDLQNQVVVLRWMRRLAETEGLTVIFTTHHPHHALWVADDALLMMGHTEHEMGSVETTLTEPNLTRLYGTAMKRIAFEHDGRKVETLTPVFEPAS
ncbi:MAG: putative ABC transporter ATP-binding protein [Nitrobacter sp.]|uniref:ABC transporter ATP-binding protein n=1 Tax=Nitrobacter sp. TaxID=29420 RepID=UPI00387DF73F